MKISKNKKYLTQDGRKVWIYEVNIGNNNFIHGAIEDSEFGRKMHTWNCEGYDCFNTLHSTDLIEQS